MVRMVVMMVAEQGLMQGSVGLGQRRAQGQVESLADSTPRRCCQRERDPG